MKKPSPFDRESAAGNDRGRDSEPELAVFDEATPARQVTPTGSDPASHDLYRRPSASSRQPADPSVDPSAGSTADAAEPSAEGFFGPTPDQPAGPVSWEPFDDGEAESWPASLADPEPSGSSPVRSAAADRTQSHDSDDATFGSSLDGRANPAPALPSISDYWPDSTTPDQPAESDGRQYAPAPSYAAHRSTAADGDAADETDRVSDQSDPAPHPYAAEPYAGQPYTGQPYTGQPYTALPYTGLPSDGRPQVDQATDTDPPESYAPESYPPESYPPEPYRTDSYRAESFVDGRRDDEPSPTGPEPDDIYTESKPFSPQGAYGVDGAEAAYDDPYARADGPPPLHRLLQPGSTDEPYDSDDSRTDRYRPAELGTAGLGATEFGATEFGATEFGATEFGDDPYAREPYDGDEYDDADGGLPVPVTAPVGAASVAAARSKRRRRRVLRAGLLVALLLLVGTGVTLAVTSGRTGPAATTATGRPASQGGTAAGEQADDDNTVSAPREGRTDAGFDLVNGTTTVNVKTADLGDDLYRISTPDGSEVRPQVAQQDGRVQLFLVRSGQAGAGAVDIALNAAVRWDLRVTGGVEQSVIDMSGSRVKSVDLAGGATRVDLRLPRPDGTLKVRMTGGINQFSVHTADPVPVRVRVGSGAGQVVLDGRTHNGIAPGALFTPATWDDGGDRVDLDAIAGMATLRVNQDD